MVWVLTIVYFNNINHIFLKAYTTKNKCNYAITKFEPKIASYICTEVKVNDFGEK